MKKTQLVTVYKLTFPNEKVYIGIAVNFEARMRVHAHLASKGVHRPLYHAIGKYGWENVRKEIVAVGLSKQEAWDMEIQLIAKHNSANFEKGYNLALGGRTKLGCKNSVPSFRKGQKLPEQHRLALKAAKSRDRIALNGKTFAQIRSENATKFSVSVLDARTNVYSEFYNVHQCAEGLGINPHAIYNHIARSGHQLKNRYTIRKVEKQIA